MSLPRRRDLVLSVHPFSRGIAFTLFEGPLSPIEWGVKGVRGKQKNALALEATKKLIQRLQPDVLVLEDSSDRHSRRAERIRRLQSLVANYAGGEAIEVRHYSRRDIRDRFKSAGAVTRYEIAQVIASQVHAFGHRLPPAPKIWNSRDVGLSLFDAASLAMTYFCDRTVGLVPEDDLA